MFSNCKSLTNLDLIDFNTEKVENMEYMFNNCSSLLNLNLFNFSIQNNTKLDNIFNGCESLLKDNIIYKDQRIYQKLLEQNGVKPSSRPVQPVQSNQNGNIGLEAIMADFIPIFLVGIGKEIGECAKFFNN